ncbi:MBL fold metallo-hydrolase [Ornithinimicrobium avium]|uniref:MBL fold metallo-hydrolase n=1 Tax=Ornithinimicrobium avium TaxID=2283195 RepID=A0A345NM01_9MICO|nr:MBL fold metallo-hydrolase [Ornithinimicrobium avium]AXH96059.1 MBL fold metallo-hydrolase [Ornithinimicrobium avium]
MPGELHAHVCGHTHHEMAGLVAGHPRGRRRFPSTVFCYRDGDHVVLFDTGYAPQPWDTGLTGRLYRRLLPPELPAGQDVAEQVDPSSVTHVVLSHLHPDHVGGLRHFPDATLVLHRGQLETVRSPRLRDGLLRGLLPGWFDDAVRDRAVVIDSFTPGPWGLATHDLFGDGRYLLVDLPGHARGHLGALVEGTALLAGDAAWGRDLLPAAQRLRRLPRWITHDDAAHLATSRLLLEAERGGLRLLFAHDEHPTGVDLLH